MSIASEVKYRRPINSQQLVVLEWLYKYRFSTSKQLAVVLDRTDQKAIQNKLQILEAQGFIGKRYEKSYKLQGKPAEYYLTPKGAKQLQQHYAKQSKPMGKIDASIIKTLYKNKMVSSDFIKHTLAIVDTALILHAVYGTGDKCKLYSANETRQHEYYPTWAPDLFVSIQKRSSKDRQRFFLDIWDGTKPFFIAVRKSRNYLTYSDKGDWPSDTYDFPVILMVCQDTKMQKKLNRQIRKALDESYEEVIYATTTRRQFEAATKPTQKIWLKIDTDDEPVKATLSSLFVTS